MNKSRREVTLSLQDLPDGNYAVIITLKEKDFAIKLYQTLDKMLRDSEIKAEIDERSNN